MPIFINEVGVNLYLFGIVKYNITQVGLQLNTSTIVTICVLLDLLKRQKYLLKLCAKLSVENIKDIHHTYTIIL